MRTAQWITQALWAGVVVSSGSEPEGVRELLRKHLRVMVDCSVCISINMTGNGHMATYSRES